ncbi:MAG: AAA family ATPase [Acidobacteriota bacterium]|nr:AAA family ATPase [Acidobacteriota bacterium]
MPELTLSVILPLLNGVKQSSSGYTSRCPAHDDRKNSLSLAEAENGKLLVNCFVGCSFQSVIAALNIAPNSNGHKSPKIIETIYDYPDEFGKVLYQNVRYEGKDFRWRRYNENGKEVWNLTGVQRVPYRLPELANSSEQSDVFMAEGEKDADILGQLGLIATNHKNWRPEFNYLLKDKAVVIFQDHDRAGVTQAQKTAQMILGESKSVKIVDCYADEILPDKHGKDVSDYLESHTLEELLELINNAPVWKPTVNKETTGKSDGIGLKVICLSDVQAEEIGWLWKPFIPVGEFTIIEGIEGLGKSWISCALACAVADGKKLPFSDSEPLESSSILMLSAEDSLSHTVKPRLVSMEANLDKIYALDEVFDLGNLNDLIKFEVVIAEYKPKLVIIDPLFSYTGGKNLNQESDSRPLARKLIAIAQKFNCAIVGIRHIGKAKGNGDARAAGLGSVAWRASARSVLIVGKDEETGERGICQTKNNLTEEAKFAVGFEIVNGQFFWKAEPSRLTKEKMLAQPKDDETKADQTEAIEFLREALRDGERSSKDVEKEAKEVGISKYALKKARATLSIKPFKKGGNYGGDKCWFMQLSETEEVVSGTEEVDLSNIRPLQPNESGKTSYSNDLTEEVENKNNHLLQQAVATTSNDLVPSIQMPAECKCGAGGFVGEDCLNCGEMIIPY